MTHAFRHHISLILIAHENSTGTNVATLKLESFDTLFHSDTAWHDHLT